MDDMRSAHDRNINKRLDKLSNKRIDTTLIE